MSALGLSDAERQIIADLYKATGRTVDDLPYTEEFEAMFAQYRSTTERDVSRHDFWRALTNMRKASRLVRKIR